MLLIDCSEIKDCVNSEGRDILGGKKGCIADLTLDKEMGSNEAVGHFRRLRFTDSFFVESCARYKMAAHFAILCFSSVLHIST
jgi:hypothetical protein